MLRQFNDYFDRLNRRTTIVPPDEAAAERVVKEVLARQRLVVRVLWLFAVSLIFPSPIFKSTLPRFCIAAERAVQGNSWARQRLVAS